MKTICWNGELIIKAENEQDTLWLMEFCDRALKEMDSYIEIDLGEIDDEGKITHLGNTWIKQFHKNHKRNDGNYVFCETNFDDHSGTEAQIIGITINSLGF